MEENTFCNLHYKPLVNVKYPRRTICVEKNGKNIWAIMISNLFNNLNAVDMWITGSIALGPVPCLFPSSVIFPLTNDLMLIFIYNFHLSDIMAPSDLLSKVDKLKSSIIALKSTMQECLLANAGVFFSFHRRVLIIMNECIFMSTQTRVCEHIQSTDTAAWALILVIPVQGIFSKPPMACQLLLSKTCSVSVWSSWALAMCFNVVSLSKKTPNMDAICIYFQMEGM